MSIASEITRIATLRDNIRTKLISLGIISDEAAKLTACSEAIEGIDEATLTVPSLSITSNPTIDSTTGLVSVSGSTSDTVSASKGYSKGLSQSISVPVSGSLQLTTQAAQTITPGTSNKTIAANRWLTGAQTIKGDSNLVAANIVSGKSIFGVSGSAIKAGTFTYTRKAYTPKKIGNYSSSADTWTLNIPLGTTKPYYVFIMDEGNTYDIAAAIGPPNNNQLTFYVDRSYYPIYCHTQIVSITNSTVTLTFYGYASSSDMGTISVFVGYYE